MAKGGRLRGGAALGAAVLAAALGAAWPGRAQPPAGPEPDAGLAPEERLWRDILACEEPLPATQPFRPWFAAAEARRQRQLRLLRTYQSLYPGGRHRDEAIGRELNVLFELAVLRGEEPAALRGRISELLRAPPSPAAEEEAAWWEIVCRRRAPDAATQPASGPALSPAGPLAADAELRAAYREYLARYPRSRHVPRLASVLFDAAVQRGDLEEMRALAATLAAGFPDHVTTRTLRARVGLEEQIGRRLELRVELVDGRELDVAELRGGPVLIVVWAGFDDAARRCAAGVERFRRAQPEVRVLGIGVDETPAATAAAARELELDWPQANDGLGWGSRYVRGWGLRGIPRVLVLDRQGCLLGVADGERWELLARRALEPAAGGAAEASRPAGAGAGGGLD